MAVRAAREELEETERFSKLLELFLGNYVNAGSRNEWPRSFNITVLCKVRQEINRSEENLTVSAHSALGGPVGNTGKALQFWEDDCRSMPAALCP